MRHNRKKDLILDFTSLLDVVMLLLFFFILYSRLDVSKAEEQAKAAENNARIMVEKAEEQAREHMEAADRQKIRYEELEQENMALKDELENDIRIVNQVTSQEANEIINFNSGNNLKILLLASEKASVPMTVRAVLNQQVIGECVVTEPRDDASYQANDVTAERLIGWLKDSGIKQDSVIMCDFVYRSRDSGSSEAYNKIIPLLDSLHSTYGYSHFYYSTTNTSIRSKKYGGEKKEDDSGTAEGN